MSLLDEHLLNPHSTGHYCQLFETDAGLLARNAAQFLACGLAAGQHAVVVAAPANTAAILREFQPLGIDTQPAIAALELILIDAEELLDQFMVGGYPDAGRFDDTVGDLVRSIHRDGGTLRAYGEMVGLLWSRGEYPAAIRLEQLWNNLRKETAFGLYCGYPIDIFGEHFESGVVDALLSAHTHLLPAAESSVVEDAVSRAMREVLGPNVIGIRSWEKQSHSPAWPGIPRGESLIFWVRRNLPEKAAAILTLARRYYHEAIGAA